MNTQDFLMQKIKEKEGNYFKVINSLIENGIDKDSVMNIYDKYKKHKNLLNNNNIYFFDYFNKEDENLNKQFENLSDDIHKEIINSNYKKIKKDMYSKKNNIMNEKTDELIRMCAEADISPKLIKKEISSKIIAFKDSEYLNYAIEKLYEEVNGKWNKEVYLNKLKNTNSKLLLNEDNKLAIEILNHEDAQTLGIPKWCVSRDKEFYFDHVNNQERFVFIYDFDEAPFAEESLKAVNIHTDGEVIDVHNRRNILISNNSVSQYNHIFNEIDKETLIYKIKNGKTPIYDEYLLAKKYAIYGLYEESKDILNLEEYKKQLAHLFSHNMTDIINSKNTINFIQELDGYFDNPEELYSYEVFDWMREVAYFDNKTINAFFETPITMKLIQKEINDNEGNDLDDILNNELSHSITQFFSQDDESRFKVGLNYIEKLKDIGITDIEKLIHFKNIHESSLDFLNENLNLSKKLDKKVVYANQSEEFFNKYFDIINLKESSDKQFTDFSLELFLGVINDRISNFNGVSYGIKSYFKDDFKEIKDKYFNIDKYKLILFNTVSTPDKKQETFLNLQKSFNIEKVSPSLSKRIITEVVTHKSYKEFESLPSNKQDEIIENRINSMPRPLKMYLSDFIKNESFDLSESHDFLLRVSKIEGFENLLEKRNKKLKNKP